MASSLVLFTITVQTLLSEGCTQEEGKMHNHNNYLIYI